MKESKVWPRNLGCWTNFRKKNPITGAPCEVCFVVFTPTGQRYRKAEKLLEELGFQVRPHSSGYRITAWKQNK